MHRKCAALILTAASALAAEPSHGPWVADSGNGQYRNPVLAADYSDPDVTRERAGLAVVGTQYGWIGLRKDADAVGGDVYLRARVEPVAVSVAPPDKPHWPSELKNVHAHVRFSYSTDGVRFTDIDQPPLTIDPGRWVGATIGLFSSAPAGTPSYVATSVGYADFDYFHVARDN